MTFNTYQRTADFDRLLGRALDGDSRALDIDNDVFYFTPGELCPVACVGLRTNDDFEPVTMLPGFTFEECVWNAASTVVTRATT